MTQNVAPSGIIFSKYPGDKVEDIDKINTFYP